uniref:Uncharacterized protein n=1 Tax=Lepeophtheirus salmonis TaxID=72036 RepID=A0A0K2UA93_LEPSM
MPKITSPSVWIYENGGTGIWKMLTGRVTDGLSDVSI